MIEIKDKAKCCGCTACASICPKKCIVMKTDFEGFVYPEVDKNNCVDCGMCEDVCPIINKLDLPKKSKAAYVVQAEADTILRTSTSGGFSDVLYRYVLNEGGFICGCVYDRNWMPCHILTDRIEDLPKFQSSKYAQSRMDDIFPAIKGLLNMNRIVCFVGTPCQVAGLKKYLRKDYEKLITVDLVCRSVPSPLLLQEYLKWQENRYLSKIQRLNCRSKTYGYHHGSLTIDFQNGKKYSGSNRVDPFMKAFHSDICSRPSCYKCCFKTPTRCSDFMIFDCWQPESLISQIYDNNKGYSNVIVYTDKGMDIFKKLQKINRWETTPEKMFQFTGGMEAKTVGKPEIRDEFYKKLIKQGFERTVYSSINITIKDKVIESMKQVLYKIGLLNIFHNKKHNSKI